MIELHRWYCLLVNSKPFLRPMMAPLPIYILYMKNSVHVSVWFHGQYMDGVVPHCLIGLGKTSNTDRRHMVEYNSQFFS